MNIDQRVKVGIIGPGNIGLDLMYKIMKKSKYMSLALVAGNETSKHLHVVDEAGIRSTDKGISAILSDEEIEIVFDATSADSHMVHAPLIEKAEKVAVDLTPAAVGGYVCPAVNLGDNINASNINLITCGGQATIPIVAAINSVCEVAYAEIVACIASTSAGPGTRNNIDEFTITTAKAIKLVGGAKQSKAIILLNPAKPPMLMNNTIYCLVSSNRNNREISNAIEDMVAKVQCYVPGYRLKVPPTFDGNKITVMVEVEGAGDYLPPYSGNLDIETSAALAVGDAIAKKKLIKRMSIR
jgi:acetaldehyde dehydrogenase